MHVVKLHPPLPPPLTHEGIEFITPTFQGGALSPQKIAAIGSALYHLLPNQDFTTDAQGTLRFSTSRPESEHTSLWRQAGLYEGITRSQL